MSSTPVACSSTCGKAVCFNSTQHSCKSVQHAFLPFYTRAVFKHKRRSTRLHTFARFSTLFYFYTRGIFSYMLQQYACKSVEKRVTRFYTHAAVSKSTTFPRGEKRATRAEDIFSVGGTVCFLTHVLPSLFFSACCNVLQSVLR